MATLLIECQAPTGNTTGTAAKRNDSATGTVTEIAVAEQATLGLYWATLTYTDSRPLGDWAIVIGGQITIVTLDATNTEYTVGNVPTAEENATATRAKIDEKPIKANTLHNR